MNKLRNCVWILFISALLFAPVLNAAAQEPAAQEEAQNVELNFMQRFELKVDAVGASLNSAVGGVLFYDVMVWDNGSENDNQLPFIVLWLVIGAVSLTFIMRFINVKGFLHAIQVVRGKYDNPDEHGEVTHFQALSAALSATVGLGNIAGVAIAVSVGGPGATFWMIMAGLFGMTTKFTECTLGQMYRKIDEYGVVSGGPMRYLRVGLEEKGLGKLGVALSILFAVLCVFASFGGGNMFQVVQSKQAIASTVPFLADNGWVYGLIMSVLGGIVIIGGIKSIARVTEKIVPFMCGIYVAAALFVLLVNFTEIPSAISAIIVGAFSPDAAFGGFIGVLVQGFRRAAFSNEAGVGSAAIAHSAAKTEEPVREGIVALLEPFIDTVVVCTITALVIVITGAYNNPDAAYASARAANNGAMLTSLAFEQSISWFPYILSVAVFLFAFSTMISWSYYGERCFTFLFGPRASLTYKVIFLIFTFLGSVASATQILDFSDLMILAMSFPNILGCYFMAGKVKDKLNEYMSNLEAGNFKTFK
ncbi:MAG: alanine/glycine:cation symporter family protein [Acidobacteriota bacterium]|nr:alanine/glycine:cation symporter family protein [Acidobacteriota bacterium]